VRNFNHERTYDHRVRNLGKVDERGNCAHCFNFILCAITSSSQLLLSSLISNFFNFNFKIGNRQNENNVIVKPDNVFPQRTLCDFPN
jgi:hypothetical protein